MRFGWAKITLVLLIAAMPAFTGCATLHMPGHSFSGPLPPLDQNELMLEKNLKRHVNVLAGIGIRALSVSPQNLDSAAYYIERQFVAMGYATYSYPYVCRGHTVRNIEAVLPGKGSDPEVVIVGAHYDSE